ncbi:MAG: hypothetical protein HY352_02775 [Candidatus Omnitrophica bacterium]|nr:hypothetical protein [Candidatus Omnitrophota bacterium]
MKRSVLVAVGIAGGVGLISFLMLAGHNQTTASAADAKKAEAVTSVAPAQPAQPAAAAQPASEKIVYTFENQDKMLEFTKIWQRRQGVVVRMTVLQAYWEQERADLDELNKKLSTDYQLDVTKNYSLDTDRRVLIEREAPPAAPISTTPAQEPSKPAGPKTP